jgi:hypothetical protein
MTQEQGAPGRDHHRTDGSNGPDAESGPVRRTFMVATVAFAAAGLFSLAGVLAGAALGTVEPAFVAGAYFCLPVAFLLLAALVVAAVRSRR